MTPYYADPTLSVHIGDCRAVMAEMPAESVHCVCTSPPYWGLRDYGVTGQLGLEPTPEQYVANMVAVFREVRRVLRKDGTLWINLGDSYAQSGKGGGGSFEAERPGYLPGVRGRAVRAVPGSPEADGVLKPKDLVGIPWRVAFALQADGWYLRSDIIWSKPNPMPESVTDRPTKAHEYVFLLSKARRYYFDNEAVREPLTDSSIERLLQPNLDQQIGSDRVPGKTNGNMKAVARWPGIVPKHGTTDRHRSDYEDMVVNAGRNLRSVWTIATQPYHGAHFATFPEKLVEPCVQAGTSARGVCPECGAPWERTVRMTDEYRAVLDSGKAWTDATGKPDDFTNRHPKGHPSQVPQKNVTTGWRPTCAEPCRDNPDLEPVPATILDPFAGSGTVGRVANRLGRRAVLIDLSADYIDQAMVRNAQAPLGMDVA